VALSIRSAGCATQREFGWCTQLPKRKVRKWCWAILFRW